MASLPVPVEIEETGMTEEELATLLASHESNAVGYYNSEIAAEQEKAINYYYGKMDDLPALDGCSSATDDTVAVHVDNGLAAILKPFVSADEVVSFAPRGPEDVEQAEQATEYVNYIINSDNPGFQIFHDWFKDALLTKLGVVKVWWEDQTREEVREVPVDAAQLEILRQSDAYLGEQQADAGVFIAQVRETVPDGRLRVENVPPEEFLISPYARSIDDTTYVAHRPGNYTRSDLIELGMDADVVNSLPAYASGENDEARKRARYADEDWGSSQIGDATADPSRDIIGVLDEYVRVDFDGDGIAELRRVIRCKDVILFNEPVSDVPFATLCPVPMPHKVYGRATADLAIDGQKISTAVLRSTMDNLYRSNNPRPVIADRAYGETTGDDLASTAPGAEIRVNDIGGIDWLQVPFSADKSFSMLEYLAQSTEERTGFQRKGNGFNANALKKNSADTATEAAIDENSRNERAEMIARIFAETGVKRLFRLILKLVNEHQPKARVIRLRNEWIEVDPSGWDPEMDLVISVGLGVGNKAEQIEQAQVVLATMERLGATPYGYLIAPEHVHKAVQRLYTAAGIKNVDEFIADPSQVEPPPPQEDPRTVEARAKMELETAKAQHKAQIDAQEQQRKQAEAQAKFMLEQAQMQAKQSLEMQKAQFEAILAEQKMNFEQQMAIFRAEVDQRMAVTRAVTDREVKMSKNRPGGDLDK